MLRDYLIKGLQILLWSGLVPLVLSVSAASLVTAALQSATNIRDSASLYAVRLVAVVGVLYLLLPGIQRALSGLLLEVLR